MTQIKICGISDLDTLAEISQLPIDYVGFVHHPGSKRHVDVLFLAKLISQVPSHIKTVIVLVNPVDSKLEYIFKWCKPDYIQLHGIESPERVLAIKEKFSTPVIKAVPIAYRDDVINAKRYEDAADMMLFDTKSEQGISGGTGKTFDWNLLANYPHRGEWFLSGGLSAVNVAEAIRTTQTPAVDASSHLERPAGSGKKDAEKVKKFVQSCTSA